MVERTLSIVVPCYNEEDSVPLFYKETIKVLTSIAVGYELIFVDDGSKDGTLQVIRKLAESDNNVRYISFSRNFGKEAALYAGLRNTSGDYVAVMDVDLQDPPELLPEMLEILDKKEYDCVATRRTDRAGEPPIRSMFARLFYRIINRISDADIVDGARDFRMMKRPVVDAIISMSEYNRFSKGIFGWVGFKTFWLSYENRERAAGTTKWSFWKLFRYAVDGIVNFSQTPLYIASMAGIGMTLLSIFYMIWIVVRKVLFGNPVAGWASTSCIILFIGGMQLFCLGIIGQYLAKVYLEVKNRPVYITRESNIEHVK